MHITNTAFKRAQVPLPPPIEQEAIAEALSDADALIESLEQLLAKKRQVKQGAMQELLTGKKRLSGLEVKPGYKQAEVGFIPEDWHLRQHGNAATFLDGKRRPVKDGDRAKMRGTIPYYGDDKLLQKLLIGTKSNHFLKKRRSYLAESLFLIKNTF